MCVCGEGDMCVCVFERKRTGARERENAMGFQVEVEKKS